MLAKTFQGLLRKSTAMWTVALILFLGSALIQTEASDQSSEPFAVTVFSESSSPGLLTRENQKSNSSSRPPQTAEPKSPHPPMCLESARIRGAFKYISLVVSVVVFVVGLVGNSALVKVIYVNKCMRSGPNILIASLALGDLVHIMTDIPVNTYRVSYSGHAVQGQWDNTAAPNPLFVPLISSISPWINALVFFPLLTLSFVFVAAHGRRLAIWCPPVQTRPLHPENLCRNYCAELMCFERWQVRW